MRKAKVTKGKFEGETVFIEGEDTEVFGQSVWNMVGNPAAMKYGIRSGFENLPLRGPHYYGKHENGLGEVFHHSELEFTGIGFHVVIKGYENDYRKVVTEEPVDERTAQRVQRGAEINLNHDKFFVELEEVTQ